MINILLFISIIFNVLLISCFYFSQKNVNELEKQVVNYDEENEMLNNQLMSETSKSLRLQKDLENAFKKLDELKEIKVNVNFDGKETKETKRVAKINKTTKTEKSTTATKAKKSTKKDDEK